MITKASLEFQTALSPAALSRAILTFALILVSSRLFLGAAQVPAELQEAHGKVPLSFEANRGQTNTQVDFVARGPGYTLFLRPSEAVLRLKRRTEGRVLRMRLIKGDTHATAEGVEELAGKVNYFIGSDPAKWRSDIPTFGRVRYREVYRGIDLVYYGNQRQLEYDFVVAPRADWRRISLTFEGADNIEIESATGDLLLHIEGEIVRQAKPVVYQEASGRRHLVEACYRIVGKNKRVGFAIGEYDASQPLVIDPVLTYSTYLGGSMTDSGIAIAVDSSGNAYVTGYTVSTDFPTVSGAFDPSRTGSTDTFVTKLNAAGSALIYSTYLGGSNGTFEAGNSIAVDSDGNAYFTGVTNASDFPTTPGAADTTHNGGDDAFITKLNATGSALVYSSYLGGSLGEVGNGIALDASDNAYVTGKTNSTDFPTTSGAFDTMHNGSDDAFVTMLNGSGSALVYSTYLGGGFADSGNAIALDPSGNSYIAGNTLSNDFPTTAGAFDTTYNTGNDAIIAKLNAAGSALVYSTYLGGSGLDVGRGVAVDSSGSAYLTGQTGSAGFPTTPDAFDTTANGGTDTFVTKLDAAAATLVYSTYLGGSANDDGRAVAVDSSGNAYVIGFTASAGFPTTPDAFDTTANGSSDVFVTKLNPQGSTLLYSTYLGGSSSDTGSDIALDASGNAYITGNTSSTAFPTTPDALDITFNNAGDAFISKIGEAPAALWIISITKSGNSVLLQGVGVPSAMHKIHATDDLSQPFDPNPIGTATADSVGNFQFTDTTGLPRRFYRVVYP